MSAKIHLERMMHRNSVAVRGETVASYALLKLVPSFEGAKSAPPLNLSLVMDVSGSMYEEDGTGLNRLRRVQNAVLAALPMLRPADSLSLVAFGHDAAVILEPTTLAERDRIAEVVRQLDRIEVDPGGTAMDAGMRLARDLLAPRASPEVLSQMLVLTDGETSGDQACRELAEQLPGLHVQLTLMGVGTEWNETLLKEMARLGKGNWYYIDADQPAETERIFGIEFGHLTSALFTDVALLVRPVRDVRIKRCRQVVPEIRDLQLEQCDDRLLKATVGTLGRDQTAKFILDLSLPARPDGSYVLSQVEATYRVAGTAGTTGPIPLQIAYAANAPSYLNAEVAKHIDEVQIFELNRNLQQAISGANTVEIQRLAQTIEKKAEVMGPRGRKKTMLARQVLEELGQGGRVSRKTQLALDDCARLADEMPLGEAATPTEGKQS